VGRAFQARLHRAAMRASQSSYAAVVSAIQVAKLTRGRPGVSFATWIADTTAAYEDWLARIAAR